MSEKMKKFLVTLILFFCLAATSLADDYEDQHAKAKSSGLVWIIMVGEDW